MMRPRNWLLLVGVVALAASGCGDSSSSDAGGADGTSGQKQVRIAFFNPVAANPVTSANYEGVQDEAGKQGAKVTAFDAGFDQAKQISQMQDAIASGQYDAFVVMPVNGAALVDVTKQAIDAGIKVVADWNNIGPDLSSIEPQVDGLTSVVAQGFSDQGKNIGEQIVAACGSLDPCNAVYMPGSFNQGSEKVRMDALTAVTDEHPSVRMKISTDGGFQAGPAQAAASDVLLAVDDVRVFATPGDQMALGIIQAVEEADMVDEVKIISAGTSQKTVQLVRDGKLFSDIVTLPYSEGVYSTRYAIQAVRGEDVPPSLDSLSLSPIGPVADAQTLSTAEGQEFMGEFAG